MRLLQSVSHLNKLRPFCQWNGRHHSLSYSTHLSLPSELMNAIETKAITSRRVLKKLRDHCNISVSPLTIKTTLGGMRGAQLLLCETSEVNPTYGISYRGYPIQQLINTMSNTNELNSENITYNEQKFKNQFHPPSSEGLLWLLLTGQLPNRAACDILKKELTTRMFLPPHVSQCIGTLPLTMHPMTQLIIGIALCQTESLFTQGYKQGIMVKEDYWKYTLSDGLSLIAKLPLIASIIYQRLPKKSNSKTQLSTDILPDPSLDWSGNIARLLGHDTVDVQDVIRLYMFLHADHESGNVSAHTAHLVGSALSDPYLAFCASMAGLAGPLHGLANQECLRFLRQLEEALKKKQSPPTNETVREFIQQEIINKGKVVPGFGHAVLRNIDPRFVLQQNFAKQKIHDDHLIDLLTICVNVVPSILMATGKVSNPYPNVDAHSGVILNHYGLIEDEFFTVLFGVARSLGIVSQLGKHDRVHTEIEMCVYLVVWDRLLNIPIERPKSITLSELERIVDQTELQE